MDREVMAEIKKLSDRVQYLEDQLVKQGRKNANLMEELEASRTSGVSSSFVGQVDKKFSEIMQTEEKIQMVVANVSGEARKQYSKYEQTADGIKTEVASLNKTVSDNTKRITNFEQTAEKISMEVSAVYEEPEILWGDIPSDYNGKNKLYAYYKADENGDVEHAGAKYKFEGYYKYNTINNKWELTSTKNIVSQFVQTKDGFKLSGDVAINGNTYQNGNIYVTGEGIKDGSAVYVCNGSIDQIAGFISYDTKGKDTYENKNRMIIAANGGNALKIVTYNTGSVEDPKVENISIGAGMWGGNGEMTEYSGHGYVYVDSPIVFSHNNSRSNSFDVKFNADSHNNKCTVDFTDATVTGLYAVFE